MTLANFVDADYLDRFLSSHGVIAFADHDNDGVEDTLVVDDCLAYATDEICGRLVQRYEPTDLAACRIIKEYSAIIAGRTLCMRRGNPCPQSLEVRYQELVAVDGLLDRIADGKNRLITTSGDRLPMRGGYAPSHANLSVDRRYNKNQIRVIRSSSRIDVNTALRRDVDTEFANG